MTKKKVKLMELTNGEWASLHEASELLGIQSKELLQIMKDLCLLRFTLFGSYTVLSKVQMDTIKRYKS